MRERDAVTTTVEEPTKARVVEGGSPAPAAELGVTGEAIRGVLSRYGIFFIFAAMLVVASLLSPAFLTLTNITNVIRQMSIIGLIALGVTGVIVSGGIDLSSGSVVGVACVVAASLAQTPDRAFYPSLAGHPVVVAILAGCAVGMAAGFVNGWFVARTLIPPFIATLGMYTAARGAAMLYTGGRPLSHLSEGYDFIGQGDFLGVPVPILVLVGMAIVTHVLYSRTKFGKFIYAIGGNEQAARVSGINVGRYKILIYTYAGMLAGMAGLVISSRIGSGQPGLGVGYELDAIAAAVIGGTSLSAGGIGTIPGTIVGALIIGVLNNTLDLVNVSAYWQQIIKGAIIVGAVVLDQRKNRGDR
jgi:inositol transport system permease protein